MPIVRNTPTNAVGTAPKKTSKSSMSKKSVVKSHARSKGISTPQAPLFRRYDISTDMKDGYWIEAVDITGTGQDDIVSYGLNSGHLTWYRNPHNPLETEEDSSDCTWEANFIDSVNQPVGMCYAPIASDKYNDIIITGDYGPTMEEINTEGGNIWWYRNPLSKDGGTLNDAWNRQYIGRATGMHRLAIGHFTRTDRWQVLGLPIVGEPHNTHSDFETVLFTEPPKDELYRAAAWERELITDTYFHVVHDVILRKFNAAEHVSHLDSALISSQEGLTWMYHQDGQWNFKNIAKGLTRLNQHGYWGLQNVDIGKYGDDSMAFIVSSGPFHGNVAYLYTKTSGPKNTIQGCEFKETQIALDGDFPILDGNGPIHHVLTGDFSGDGNDEFIYATRDDGAYYFRIADFDQAKTVMTRISHYSAARSTASDFNGDGRLDFATICYAVDGYYVADKKYFSVYYNMFGEVKVPNEDGYMIPNPGDEGFITLKHVDDTELLVKIKSSSEIMTKWLISIYGFKMSIVYMPQNSSTGNYPRGTMFKVISGQISIQATPNTEPEIVNNCIHAIGTRDMTIRSDEHLVRATKETVAWVIEPEFDTTMMDFPVVTDKETVNQSIDMPRIRGFDKLQFEMYNDENGEPMGFWNMTGFTIRLNNKKLSHQQFWLADRGVNCGIHDHRDLAHRKAFCEVHTCIVNGTGYGGMFRSDKSILTPADEVTREDMTRLPVPSGYEHGPMWSWGPDGKPARRSDGSVKYRPHAWIAGDGDPRTDLPSMDFWIAHELTPGIVHNALEES